MANQIVPGDSRKVIRTVFVDGAGNPQLELNYLTEERTENNILVERHVGANITLADGTSWNQGMARGDKPLHLAQCGECQKPGHDRGANGRMLAKNAVRCFRCGMVLCPCHRKRADKNWLCPSCHRKQAVLGPIRSLLRAIFFKTEDE